MGRAKHRNKGVMTAVLRAFIPYTKENLLLSFAPGKFFNHLDRLDYLSEQTGASRETVRVTISRAKREGLLKIDDNNGLITTWKGKIKARVRPDKKLRHYLVIIFDIPEKYRKDRDLLRSYLSANHCEMVQKSVWMTRYDIYDELLEVIEELNINSYVSVFTADKIK